MIAAQLSASDDFDEWRALARRLIGAGVAPENVSWSDGQGPADLFGAALAPLAPGQLQHPIRASRAFIELARTALLHRDAARLPLLYRLLWRLQAQPRLIDDAADRDVGALHRLAKAVRRDIHKMRAFVRFRVIPSPEGGDRYVAWFEPEHAIERVNAAFFIDRFANQCWSILTPRLSLHWDGTTLAEGPAASRAAAAGEDGTEALWLRYYQAIFNPSRLKVAAMLKEMPRKYWHNLPEATAIADMIAGARARELTMIAQGGADDAAPPPTLAELAQGLAACRRCPIGENGTRPVPGEGPADAALMIVGEQAGDVEEQLGRPFVGPAGQLLDRHLAAAGIDRNACRVTNAVRHFKFTPQGKRRLHQTPTAGEIDKCRWWLDAERALVRPRIVLALGASAARALTGRTPNISRERGQPIALADNSTLWLTAHPSYLLRLDGAAREREEHVFQRDLALVAQALSSGVGQGGIRS